MTGYPKTKKKTLVYMFNIKLITIRRLKFQKGKTKNNPLDFKFEDVLLAILEAFSIQNSSFLIAFLKKYILFWKDCGLDDSESSPARLNL